MVEMVGDIFLFSRGVVFRYPRSQKLLVLGSTRFTAEKDMVRCFSIAIDRYRLASGFFPKMFVAEI